VAWAPTGAPALRVRPRRCWTPGNPGSIVSRVTIVRLHHPLLGKDARLVILVTGVLVGSVVGFLHIVDYELGSDTARELLSPQLFLYGPTAAAVGFAAAATPPTFLGLFSEPLGAAVVAATVEFVVIRLIRSSRHVERAGVRSTSQ
jgi:hypothetical protein